MRQEGIKILGDEICGSVYTRNLRGTSTKAKANSIQGLCCQYLMRRGAY